MMEIALLENIQREDLNAIEEAKAYEKLIKKLGYTQEELASRIGKSREHVANTLRLLKLPVSLQGYVTVSYTHLRTGCHCRAPTGSGFWESWSETNTDTRFAAILRIFPVCWQNGKKRL